MGSRRSFLLALSVLSVCVCVAEPTRPTLHFCVPVKQDSGHISPAFPPRPKSRWWHFSSVKSLLFFRDSGRQDGSVEATTYFLMVNQFFGFRQCEALGHQVSIEDYSKGKLIFGDFVDGGSIQLKIQRPDLKRTAIGIVSEVTGRELRTSCSRTASNEGILKLFAPDVEKKLIGWGRRSTLLALPQPADPNSPFGLYVKSKEGRNIGQIFSYVPSPVVPLLWPLLLSKLRPTVLSMTATFSLAAHKFTLSLTPTGDRGMVQQEHARASRKVGIITDLLYGSSISIYANISFHVSPARSGALGRDFGVMKTAIVEELLNVLLKARALPANNGSGTCRCRKHSFMPCDLHGNSTQEGLMTCSGNTYVSRRGNRLEIDDAPLLEYQRRNPRTKMYSVLWRKDRDEGTLNVWNRRNCAPLCNAVLNYSGTEGENKKFSLRELYRFVALWHRFIDFPHEFVRLHDGDNNEANGDHVLAAAFSAGLRHAHPIALEVKRAVRNSVIHGAVTAGRKVIEKNFSNSCDPREAHACNNGTRPTQTDEKKKHAPVIFSQTPHHLNPQHFKKNWESVSFSAQNCVYVFTPDVGTIDFVVSSSVMAAMIAWIIVLLSLWLVLGELAVYFTTNYGVTLPSFIQVAQAPLRVHVLFFHLSYHRHFSNSPEETSEDEPVAFS